jgi:hypothetical protein
MFSAQPTVKNDYNTAILAPFYELQREMSFHPTKITIKVPIVMDIHHRDLQFTGKYNDILTKVMTGFR